MKFKKIKIASKEKMSGAFYCDANVDYLLLKVLNR